MANVSTTNARANTEPRTDSVRVFYLAGNALHSVELRGATGQTIQEWQWGLPRSSAHEDYAGLSCESGGTVIAHVSKNVSTDPLRARRSDIVLLDVHRRTIAPLGITTDSNLSWPVISPDGTWLAATAYGAGPDALAIVDRNAKKIKLATYSQGVSPHSWSARGDKIYATALEKSGQGPKVVEYAVKQERFTAIVAGSRPVPSGSKGLLAFLDPESGVIRVNDSNGVQVVQISKGFKDVVGWIDDFRLLAISSTGGPDDLGIVDIRTRDVIAYSLATRGEINGACIAPKQRK